MTAQSVKVVNGKSKADYATTFSVPTLIIFVPREEGTN